MAKQSNQQAPVVRLCEKCGREIPVGQFGIPVDYVWRDGRTLCHECNKKEGRRNGK